jgi:uncharacterized membrane protein
MNIRLFTISALAAVGVIAAGGTAELAIAAQTNKPVQQQNFSKYARQKQKTYGLSTSQMISCKAGRNTVAELGFRLVHKVKCSGTTYTYLAQRHGHDYRIKLNALTGQISHMKRV